MDNQTITIICEGKSEYAYIQELNRFFREKEIKVNFFVRKIGTGLFNEVVKIYKQEYRNNKKVKLYIWVDKDIYERNNQDSMNKYKNKKENIPNFHFNTFNFEDFLVLHLEKEKVLEHQRRCEQRNHFKIPLHEKEYLPLINEIFPKYTKGSLPSTFISDKSLKLLFSNNEDLNIKFKSDFVDIIEPIVRKYI
jgi:hypothetical protein